jgi:positive regulator of sigma E activity
MIKSGKIIKVTGDTALVKLERVGGTCETCVCQAGGGDGNCQSDNSFYATASNPINAPTGSRVEVEILRSKILSTVLVVFWIPLILTGLFGYGAYYASKQWMSGAHEGLIAIASLIGLVIGGLIVGFVEKRTVGKNRGVVILRLLEPPPDSSANKQSVMERLADPQQNV